MTTTHTPTVPAPYRIGTDARPDWKIRARTHGPIRPRTLTTQVQTGTAPVLDITEAHRRGALALARKINPAAVVTLHSRSPYGDAFDWSVILPAPDATPTPTDDDDTEGEGGVIESPRWPDGCPLTLNELAHVGAGHLDCQANGDTPAAVIL